MTRSYRVARIVIAASLGVGVFSARDCLAQTAADGEPAAGATAICVQCKDPDVTYRCDVKDAQRVNQIRGGTRALEFVCITQLAKVGGHQSCRAGSGYAGPCIGEQRLIDLSKSDAAAVVNGVRSGDSGAGSDAQKADAPAVTETKQDGPPRTLEELARVTVSKSKKQIADADEKVQEAGSAVGKAIKQSWGCLTSLFTDCK